MQENQQQSSDDSSQFGGKKSNAILNLMEMAPMSLEPCDVGDPPKNFVRKRFKLVAWIINLNGLCTIEPQNRPGSQPRPSEGVSTRSAPREDMSLYNGHLPLRVASAS